MVVNAHGCGVIVAELLENGTRVMVKLISNGSSKEGHVVLWINELMFGVRLASPLTPLVI